MPITDPYVLKSFQYLRGTSPKTKHTEQRKLYETGFPAGHCRAFQRIADSQETVIMSRANGPDCTQLVNQGYASKGYSIKTKSCTWGPMAGFVLMDPRFNKKGAGNTLFNEKETRHAMLGAENLAHPILDASSSNRGWWAAPVPIVINDERIDWFFANRAFDAEKNAYRVSGRGRDGQDIVFTFTHDSGKADADDLKKWIEAGYSSQLYQSLMKITIKFRLRPVPNSSYMAHDPGRGVRNDLFYVLIDKTSPYKQRLFDRNTHTFRPLDMPGAAPIRLLGLTRPLPNTALPNAVAAENFEPYFGGAWPRGGKTPDGHEHVIGLGNPSTTIWSLRDSPHGPPTGYLGYRAAVTGDYDLFSFFPKKAKYDHNYRDKRMTSLLSIERDKKQKVEKDEIVTDPATGRVTIRFADQFEKKGVNRNGTPRWVLKDIYKGYAYGENNRRGNITPRGRELCDQLNRAIAEVGYRGGVLCHHSDEGGRPFYPEPDQLLIAFVPGETQPIVTEDYDETARLLRCCSRLGYAVVLNYSWLRCFPFCTGFVPQWRSLGDDRDVASEEDMWGAATADVLRLMKTWNEILDDFHIRKK